jgi:photosystem II stability/assembly factor-like uncharacterized protein
VRPGAGDAGPPDSAGKDATSGLSADAGPDSAGKDRTSDLSADAGAPDGADAPRPAPDAREAGVPDHPPVLLKATAQEALRPPGESNIRSVWKASDTVVLLGTEETADIYRSTDSGLSFTKVEDAFARWRSADVRAFVRISDGSILATTSRGGNVLRSTNDGATWSRLSAIDAERSLDIIEAGSVLLCGSRRTASHATSVFRSTDRGRSWTEVVLDAKRWQNVESLIHLGDGVVLAGVGGMETEGVARIFRSQDYGKTWQRITEIPSENDVMQFLRVDGRILASFRDHAEIFASDDGGSTWSRVVQFAPVGQISPIAFFTLAGTEYVLTCGTTAQQATGPFTAHIWISADRGRSFSELLTLRNAPTRFGCWSVVQVDGTTLLAATGNHEIPAVLYRVTLTP